MTCKCGGWGVQDVQSYEVFPCGPRCVNGPLSITLRQTYRPVLNEEIPDKFKRLLDALK